MYLERICLIWMEVGCLLLNDALRSMQIKSTCSNSPKLLLITNLWTCSGKPWRLRRMVKYAFYLGQPHLSSQELPSGPATVGRRAPGNLHFCLFSSKRSVLIAQASSLRRRLRLVSFAFDSPLSSMVMLDFIRIRLPFIELLLFLS